MFFEGFERKKLPNFWEEKIYVWTLFFVLFFVFVLLFCTWIHFPLMLFLIFLVFYTLDTEWIDEICLNTDTSKHEEQKKISKERTGRRLKKQKYIWEVYMVTEHFRFVNYKYPSIITVLLTKIKSLRFATEWHSNWSHVHQF